MSSYGLGEQCADKNHSLKKCHHAWPFFCKEDSQDQIKQQACPFSPHAQTTLARIPKKQGFLCMRDISCMWFAAQIILMYKNWAEKTCEDSKYSEDGKEDAAVLEM